jgi:hypothetical protein
MRTPKVVPQLRRAFTWASVTSALVSELNQPERRGFTVRELNRDNSLVSEGNINHEPAVDGEMPQSDLIW